MSWLIVAKMPLLMSSRITSAGLTPSSSASSLTVIVAGSSTAPRMDGSTTWTAVPPKAPSRRGGLRGPRRPRVPLLLRAICSSPARGGHELVREIRGDGRLERATQGATTGRPGDARFVAADIGAAAVRATRRVKHDRAVRCADDAQQRALLAIGSAEDAGPGGDHSPFEGPRGGAYDVTSSTAAFAL